MEKDRVNEVIPDMFETFEYVLYEMIPRALSNLLQLYGSKFHSCPYCGEVTHSFGVTEGVQFIRRCNECKQKFVIKVGKKGKGESNK